MRKIVIIVLIPVLLFLFSFFNAKREGHNILSYEINLQQKDLQFYWKKEDGSHYYNFQNLKTELNKQNKKLVFAMNGGMFIKDFSPLGLYIEKGVQKKKINTANTAYGNFYMQPNGVFYLSKDKKPVVCKTTDFNSSKNIQYATQSGPMLVVDGKLHPKFNKGSSSKHIRNGVGILPNGNVLLAISKERINFYDFASFFKEKGCKNALYLDGFVSRAYLPSKNWEQWDGNFGVIIAETTNNK
ncbi:MAG: phosphodiester glycosidase family protein [Flavobacteriaceae bacterium]|nr:phosphodiester glycosidase family protein [Flavobacteriaceae bacterium]